MRIKLFCVDVDGTLTDGNYQISSDGIVTKTFFTRDFHGLMLLQQAGIFVMILTQSADDCIWQQYHRLPDCCKTKLFIFNKVDNKVEKIETTLKKWGLTWDNVAYMGDAENDLEAIEKARMSACPKDAIQPIKEAVKNNGGFIAENNGGRGSVHDFVNYIFTYAKE